MIRRHRRQGVQTSTNDPKNNHDADVVISTLRLEKTDQVGQFLSR
jgi:hypothetical protein